MSESEKTIGDLLRVGIDEQHHHLVTKIADDIGTVVADSFKGVTIDMGQVTALLCSAVSLSLASIIAAQLGKDHARMSRLCLMLMARVIPENLQLIVKCLEGAVNEANNSGKPSVQ